MHRHPERFRGHRSRGRATRALRALTRLGAALLVLCGVGIAATVRAQPSPVGVELSGTFGPELLRGGGYQSLHVRLQNKTNAPIRGVLAIAQRGYDAASARYELPVDLPPRARRGIETSVFVSQNAGEIVASFRVDGTELARSSAAMRYDGAPTIVVVDDPPRLRGNLLDLDVNIDDPSSGTRLARAQIGTVPVDPDTGDLVFPSRPHGYSSVGLMVLAARMLPRFDETAFRALVDWVHAGGKVLVFPQDPSQLATPRMRELVGDVAFASVDSKPAAVFVPPGAPFVTLAGPRVSPEVFGGSVEVGLGRVYLAGFDGMSPPYAEAPETRVLVRSVLTAANAAVARRVAFSFGRQEETLGYVGSSSDQTPFTSLRAALDPNEGYRPALVLAGLLILLYVVLVGPVNFSIIQKRGTPTLALLTTPLLAGSCLVSMLVVGYFGKGVSMRFRRIELIEASEHAGRAMARRYTGLFYTRPASLALDVPRDATARRIVSTGGVPPVTRPTPTGEALGDLSGHLWETAFLREDRMLSLGRGVRFERSMSALTAVVNETPYRIRHAMLLGEGGHVYPIGDLAPGSRAAIATTYTQTLPIGSYSPEEELRSRFGGLFALSQEEARLVSSLVDSARGAAGAPPESRVFLLAIIELPRTEKLAAFSREHDLAVLRVMAHDFEHPVAPSVIAPQPSSEEVSGGAVELESATELPDAGVAEDGGTP